jgi:hypothetical protein
MLPVPMLFGLLCLMAGEFNLGLGELLGLQPARVRSKDHARPAGCWLDRGTAVSTQK